MSQSIKVLLAEDEAALGTIIKESLESRDFQVDLHHDGEAVMKAYRAEIPDVLVLDVMMPKKDGFTLASEIRRVNPNVPIIFLTAKSRTEDVVEGFGHGANDYLKKPFSMEELIVRIKALVKRPQADASQEEWLRIGIYYFHLQKQILKFETEEQPLTYREAQLLHALYLNKNELTDRSLILNKLWGNDDFFSARSMDVFITKLRKKLLNDPNIQILNIRGYGFKLVC